VGWETARKDPAYGRSEWRRARLAALRRASWRCERGLPGCAGTATEVNHRRGLAADPHHADLEAVCTPCHRQITAAQGNAATRRRDETPFVPRTRW
jgi:hypothetical protein